MSSTGRKVCLCGAQILDVLVNGFRVTLDAPAAEHGDTAVEHTAAGGWRARHVPVGEDIRPGVEHRHQRHTCPDADPPRDLSEPARSPDPAWRQAITDRNASKRRGRRGPRAKPITGYRINPQ